MMDVAGNDGARRRRRAPEGGIYSGVSTPTKLGRGDTGHAGMKGQNAAYCLGGLKDEIVQPAQASAFECRFIS